MTILSLLATSLATLCVSGVVIDKPRSYNTNWVAVGTTSSDTPIDLVLAVKQRNIDELLRRLDIISDPRSDEYGNWMKMSEVHDLVAPHERSLLIVKEWLLRSSSSISRSDITSVTPNSDFIKVKTTIGVANELLGCKYMNYAYKGDNAELLGLEDFEVSRMDVNCDYHVPAMVAPHLDFIAPTKRFPVVSKLKIHGSSNSTKKSNVGAGDVTPSVIKDLYKVGTTVGSASGNLQGIASFVRQYYSQDSLEDFWKDYDIDTDNVTKTDSADGDGDGLEALLDTQYITAIGELVPLQVWYNSGTFSNAMLDFVTTIQTATNPPLLFSVSYGEPEANWGTSSVERLNSEFAKVTSTGTSIFFASGDSGAGGGCTYDEAFEPEFPASSPYVTSVGGVEGGNANESPIGESVWIDGGGGFSTVAGTQSWQETVVSSYLEDERKLPDSAQYNASGRGYPDISAQSVDFVIVRGEEKLTVDGTSCASPTAAGVFALLNDLRLQNGMTSLGYLNPFIYQTAASDDTAFNDVTDGYNKGCSTFQQGFYAATGWDPASGFGSPNYEVLSKYVLETGEKTKKFARK